MSDNKTIEVIDKIAEQFGVAIDWTQKDVVPYLQDLISRCKTSAIVQYSIWILMIVICVAILSKLLCHILKQYILKNKESIWVTVYGKDEYEPSTMAGIVIFFSALLIVAFSILSIVCLHELFNWIFIPEFQFYQMLIK